MKTIRYSPDTPPGAPATLRGKGFYTASDPINLGTDFADTAVCPNLFNFLCGIAIYAAGNSRTVGLASQVWPCKRGVGMLVRVFQVLFLGVLCAFVTETQALTLNPGGILIADPSALSDAGGIIQINPISGAQTAVASDGVLNNPISVALGDNLGIFVGNSGIGSQIPIVKIDPATGNQTIVSSGGNFSPFAHSHWVAVASNGDILVTDNNAFNVAGFGGAVFRIDPATGAQTTVSSGGNFFNPRGIVIEASGDILVADVEIICWGQPGCQQVASDFVGKIFRVNPVTGVQTLVSSGGLLGNPQFLTLAPDGKILVTDQISHAVVRVNPVTGTQTAVSTGFTNPMGVAVAANGEILVVDPDAFPGTGAVYRVDPETGNRALVASGELLKNPFGIAVVPTPVPEPSTLILLGSGLAGVAAWRRRRAGR